MKKELITKIILCFALSWLIIPIPFGIMYVFKLKKLVVSDADIELNSIDKQINSKNKELDKITSDLNKTNTTIQSKRDELDKINNDIIAAKQELSSINHQTNQYLELSEYGLFDRKYNFSDSTKYKEKLDSIRREQKDMISNGTAGNIVSPITMDGSKSKGEAMQKQLIKSAIRGFNGESDALLVKINASNLEQKQKSLIKSFEQLNKLYQRNFIEISNRYLELKQQELQLACEYELQKQEEKELLKEQREKEKEDKKIQAELAKKRKQLEKDKEHFLNMVDNVRDLLSKTTDDAEIKNLKNQLLEYENKLSDIEEMEEDIEYREGHATAGYVYVISNIGAFGENVYKIGVTRRLDPLDRIRELSNASVPFHFDVHALIFSEQAFALESELHNELHEYKLNKVNMRKEYFKAPFSKIKEILNKHSELTIELTEVAEAFEYRQSIARGEK